VTLRSQPACYAELGIRGRSNTRHNGALRIKLVNTREPVNAENGEFVGLKEANELNHDGPVRGPAAAVIGDAAKRNGAAGSHGFQVWFPVVDTFRTLTGPSTAAIRPVLLQIDQLASV
jgi:hypothetical protein